MQKPDYLSSRIAHPPVVADGRAAKINRRLVVLVSSFEMDTPAVARRILEVADAFRCPILFIGLCSNRTQEPSLRRQLVTLSAMVRDEALSFETRIEIGKDWMNLVRSNSQEGDVFLCFARQKTGMRGSMYRSLLQSNFASTVYMLDDDSSIQPGRAAWVSSALAWAGSILIILAFLWLQIKALPSPEPSKGLAFILSIPFETWLIMIWNSLIETT